MEYQNLSDPYREIKPVIEDYANIARPVQYRALHS